MSNQKISTSSTPLSVEAHEVMGNYDIASRELSAVEARTKMYADRRQATDAHVASRRRATMYLGAAAGAAGLVLAGGIVGHNMASSPAPVVVEGDASEDPGVPVEILQKGETVEGKVREQNPDADPRPIVDAILNNQDDLGSGLNPPEGHPVVPADTQNYKG